MSHVKLNSRHKRKIRIRKKIKGTSERPRLSVFRSNKYIYAQIIDDVEGKTLVSASSGGKQEKSAANKAAAASVGKLVAEKALEKKIDTVVFDRNGYRFHGVIKEIADSARTAGLKF